MVAVVALSACDDQNAAAVDKLNEEAYAYHYRNLDSTKAFAIRALKLSNKYSAGRAEAYNNLAFYHLAKMQYSKADRLLSKISEITDNQVELLISDIQQMRLCQRESRNKDFYEYRENAIHKLKRIKDESNRLDPHQKKRMVYAESEFYIVSSTYYYYVGLRNQSIKALEDIDPNGPILQDTAQWMNYLYNVGSGGIISQGSSLDIAETEMDYLTQCYLLSLRSEMPYWEAQALQAISEHLQSTKYRRTLLKDFAPSMNYINVDNMPDSLLAGNLAQRAVNIFQQYGDVYQSAGGYRTLAECYWSIQDYHSAMICLHRALNNNKAINQAPDLVASIREQLSLVYSAVDDKPNSDRNRNIYLDLQEQTRQDRLLEARASQLDRSVIQLNIMLVAVIIMIILVLTLLFFFDLMRKRSDAKFSIEALLQPLQVWKDKSLTQQAKLQDKYEELQEQKQLELLHLQQNEQRNLEQRAKISLVNSITPFIDRIVNEVRRLEANSDKPEVRQQRYQYIAELTDTINDYNNVLTQWIQMRQGDIRLKIESFRLQELFDIVQRGRMGFQLKGVELNVRPTDATVKADKVLTLFMINTISDNARKFTPEGGKVEVFAENQPDYVEVSVKDTGCGMDEEHLSHIFDRTYTGGHGFGLKNCNGIIEKYKKISRIFSVCQIGAESVVGQGTRIFFRLPKGVMRLILVLITFTSLLPLHATGHLRGHAQTQAARYADSAYFCNVNGEYRKTLVFADSCHKYLSPRDTLTLLDISNETAVAALALHKWDLYHKNNTIYTQLFRQASADNSLPDYVRNMQRSESNKMVSVVLLVILLIIIFPAYYFLYYRHQLNYRLCIERINAMNKLLMTDVSDTEKLRGIEQFSNFQEFSLSPKQQATLGEIVEKIRQALMASISKASTQQETLELTEDELRRIRLDSDKLYVSNNVLDNCLSTLKHETMYYPSRIRQLVDGTDDNLHGIDELTSYYKELYGILSQQAMRQIRPARCDREAMNYLLELLKKVNKNEKPYIKIDKKDNNYIQASVIMKKIILTDEQRENLFTPYTVDLKFLLCRQIVREMGEATNLRACGISAQKAGTEELILINLPSMLFKETKI